MNEKINVHSWNNIGKQITELTYEINTLKQQLADKNKQLNNLNNNYEHLDKLYHSLKTQVRESNEKLSQSISREKVEKEINWLTEEGSNRIDMMRIHLLKERLGITVNLLSQQQERKRKVKTW